LMTYLSPLLFHKEADRKKPTTIPNIEPVD